MANINTDNLHKAILRSMEDEIKRIVDEEAKNASNRVEERIRAMTGQVTAKVATWIKYK